jgi:hypothetical protein
MRRVRIASGLIAVLCAVAPATGSPASAATAGGPEALHCKPAPLMAPGKTLLQDRVLVRPGATLSAQAGAAGGTVVPAFSVLFVYARSPDGKFVQVGASSACKPDGWIAADHLAPWRHTIVAAFTPRASRAPVVFFGSNKAADTALAAPDQPPADVVAREPETPVDINKQFYLLPILEAEPRQFPGSKQPVDVLQVAALSQPGAARPGNAAGSQPGAGHGATAERQNFRTGVVFVTDATVSMDPYLDRTRQVLSKIIAKVHGAHLEDRVRFGLVAFRDDPHAVPKIEWGTRIFADPNKVATPEQWDQAVAGLGAARVSSRAVAEDVYAGMETAIDHIDWSGFDARFIVLVTDASAREPGSGLVVTKLDEGALALLAREKGIAIMAVHLLTKEGGPGDHALAEKQYRVMTAFPGRGPLYYQVPTGSVSAFGEQAEIIANGLVQLIENAEDNGSARPDSPPPPAAPQKGAEKPPGAAAADIAAVGYAMRLAYLGKLQGAAAPPMFESWALDRDLAHNDVVSLDIRVLLSKSQLSDLAATVSALYGAFEKSLGDPSDLAQQLRSALLTLSRDPNKIGSASNRDLTKAALDEYLDGLPFKSRVMSMDEDTWLNMSPGDQQELIDHLAVDLELYHHMEDDVAHWVKLAPGAPAEDAVYPVPFNALP